MLGRHTTAVDMLLEQRTWLQGAETGAVVVVLDFAGPGGMLGVPRIAGTVVEATLSLYPGTAPRRALLGDDVAVSATAALPAAPGFEAELVRHAQWLAANPWAGRLPATVADIRLVRSRGQGDVLVDSAGAVVRIADDATADQLLAITGGHPVDVFGELDGSVIRPLTVAVDGELVAL